MKFFLTFASVLAALVGATLVFAPPSLYVPAGIALTGGLQGVAHGFGATLLSLAAIDWLARNGSGQAAMAVLLANFVVQLLSGGLVLWMLQQGAGAALVPALLIHLALAILFLWFATRAGASPRQASH